MVSVIHTVAIGFHSDDTTLFGRLARPSETLLHVSLLETQFRKGNMLEGQGQACQAPKG